MITVEEHQWPGVAAGSGSMRCPRSREAERDKTGADVYLTRRMSSAIPPAPSEHDPELARFLDAIVDLSAQRHSRGPDEFLDALGELADTFRGLRRYRSEAALGPRLGAFVRKRFDLVDDASEYALAWDEVVVLTMALENCAPLVFPALKSAIERMSARLAADGIPALFGQMLRRTRQLSRQHGDAELAAWIQGVINALPGD
jgi:hypothetical protein